MKTTSNNKRKYHQVAGSPSSEDGKYNLWVALRHTDHVLLKVRNKELNQYGISTSMAGVLRYIQTRASGATPQYISRLMLREPHSVSGILKRMEKQGLVKKVKSKKDKRSIKVILTKEGLSAYQNASNRESIHNAMSDLSDEECLQMMTLLKKIRDKAIRDLGWK
jgi:DNA-binding MarR family transcriptional regulator